MQEKFPLKLPDECIVKNAGVETSSGSITLRNSSGTLDVKSISGKILVAYKDFERQDINIGTSSGSVTLELPGTAEFLIDAGTSSGHFQSDFPVTTAGNADKNRIQGQVGTKDNKVMIRTSSGSIKILKK